MQLHPIAHRHHRLAACVLAKVVQLRRRLAEADHAHRPTVASRPVAVVVSPVTFPAASRVKVTRTGDSGRKKVILRLRLQLQRRHALAFDIQEPRLEARSN